MLLQGTHLLNNQKLYLDIALQSPNNERLDRSLVDFPVTDLLKILLKTRGELTSDHRMILQIKKRRRLFLRGLKLMH